MVYTSPQNTGQIYQSNPDEIQEPAESRPELSYSLGERYLISIEVFLFLSLYIYYTGYFIEDTVCYLFRPLLSSSGQE